MAQLVESLSVLLVIVQESKKYRHMMASQACIAPSVWMTKYHHHQQGGAHNWVNLIKVMVPALTMYGPPHPQSDPSLHLYYHRDIFSLITLDFNAVITLKRNSTLELVFLSILMI